MKDDIALISWWLSASFLWLNSVSGKRCTMDKLDLLYTFKVSSTSEEHKLKLLLSSWRSFPYITRGERSSLNLAPISVFCDHRLIKMPIWIKFPYVSVITSFLWWLMIFFATCKSPNPCANDVINSVYPQNNSSHTLGIVFNMGSISF